MDSILLHPTAVSLTRKEKIVIGGMPLEFGA
jgi:hypothetical protein